MYTGLKTVSFVSFISFLGFLRSEVAVVAQLLARTGSESRHLEVCNSL